MSVIYIYNMYIYIYIYIPYMEMVSSYLCMCRRASIIQPSSPPMLIYRYTWRRRTTNPPHPQSLQGQRSNLVADNWGQH